MEGTRVKGKNLWRIRVAVHPDSEDAVSCLLESVLHRPPSLYTDVQQLRTWATVYLPKVSDWSPQRRTRIVAGLEEIKRLGLSLPRIHVAASRLANEDWAESWKRHFKPLEIARQLLVLPSWSRRQPASGQKVVVLDPGLSFGTGNHPTTRFCLEELVRARRRRTHASLLDAGCGSGILAIAAARIGYDRIEAFDFDPAAVRIAGENAANNGLRDRLKLARRDLTRLPVRTDRPFDVVCANLTSDLLVSHAQTIAHRVAPGGRLVLAGILITQFKEVEEAFARLRFALVRSRRGGEWRSGSFERSCK